MITFAVLVCLYLLACLIREWTIFNITLTASNNMHRQMIYKIARSPIVFFDSNPIGRIMTRLAKDIALLDLLMPYVAMMTSLGVWRATSVFCTIMVLQPWILLVVVVATTLMYFAYAYVKQAMV